MNGTKQYYIEINGLQKSIDAVDALNKQLNALEKRINTLSSKSVNVSSSSGGAGKELDAEEKLQRQIINAEDKIIAAKKEEYQILLQQKQEFKEINELQKQNVAQARLEQDAYANTMQGMKAKLADIKTVIHNTDLGDTQTIGKLTTEANEITNKLKEMEAAYGTFGRNVGNYANGVAEGMQKLVIKVGDTERTFESAKQAARELGNELKTMAVNGEQGTEAYKELDKTVKQLNSTIKDVEKSSVAMDSLLDSMQSIIAIASTAKGLGALFGLDNEKLEQSIQKLIALQNVMKGIETINKQLTTQEGIGMWLTKGNDKIDKFVDSLLGLNKTAIVTEKTVNTLGKTVNTVGNVAAASSVKVTKGAAAVTKMGVAFKFLLKAIKIGLIIEAVNWLGKLMGLWGKNEEAIDSYTKAINTAKQSVAAQAIELKGYIRLTETFNGTEKEEARLVNILNEKYGTTIGRYKTLKEWKDKLIEQGPKYLRLLEKQALLQAIINDMVEEEYNKAKEPSKNQAQQEKNYTWWDAILRQDALVKKTQELYRKVFPKKVNMDDFLWANVRRNNLIKKTMEEIIKLEAELYGGAEEATESVNDSSNAIKEYVDIEKMIWEARMALMKDGLAKRILELERQREVEIAEAKKTGQMVGQQERAINAKYNALIAKDKENAYNEMFEAIKNMQFDINKDEIEQEIKEIEQNIDEIVDSVAKSNELYASADFKEIFGEINKQLSDSFKKRIDIQKEYEHKNIELVNKNLKEETDLRIKGIKNLEQQELEAEQKRYEDLRDQAEQYLSVAKTEEERKEANERLEDIERQHATKIKQIETKAYQESLDELTEYRNKVAENNQRGYDIAIKNAEDFKNSIEELLNKQPVLTKAGFINIGATKKQFAEAKDAAKTAIDNINNEITKLETELNNADAKQKVVINESIENLKKLRNEIEHLFDNGKGQPDWGEWWEKFDYWIQQVGQAATSIIQSIGEINQAAYEKQMEALEKQTEALEEQLNKQKELTQKYADDVNGIEDELSTARGDRRQHLIDQLNAQIAAQRESFAEEKRIEKEQEKLDAKKKKLEEENNKRKKSQAITTALINAALAISNAAVNTWPIPAVPMMALAAAVGAAQVAAVKAAKYADGGVIQGKSHAQGGVNVLGGRANVEGGEYITNKRTTAQNVELLDYINSKKKKLDLSDLIEFYSTKPRASIKGIKTRFADGGTLPSLRTDINLNDRILTAMENYNERPVVVSVVEIENKMDDVRNVRALAGL